MASRSDIEAGSAFVRLYLKAKEFKEGLQDAIESLKSFASAAALVGGLVSQISLDVRSLGDSISSLGSRALKFGGLVGGFGASLAAAFVKPVKDASELEETMSKFAIVFGESADSVLLWSEHAALAFGRSRQEIRAFLAEAQDLFVPLGFAADAATELSKEVTTLAFDLGSFNNVADADAMRDLQSALTGSGEVMKKYGVIVNEAAVKQQLLLDGIDIAVATDQQKVMARWQIILKGTAAAQGDVIRTASSWANSWKAVLGAAKDLSAAIGTALLADLSRIALIVREVLEDFSRWVVANQDMVQIVAKFAAGLLAAGVAIGSFGAATIVFGAFTSSIGHIISLFGTMLSIILPAVQLWSIIGAHVSAAASAAFAAVGPFISLSGIMAALGAGLSTVWATLAPIIAAFATVAGVVAAVVVVVGALVAAFIYLTDPLKNLIPVAKTVMAALADFLQAVFRGDFVAMADSIVRGVKLIMLATVNALFAMWKTALERIRGLIAGFGVKFSEMMQARAILIRKTFTELIPLVFKILRLLFFMFRDTMDQLPPLFAYAIGQMIREGIKGFVEFIRQIGIGITELFNGLVTGAKSFGPAFSRALVSGDFHGVAESFTFPFLGQLEDAAKTLASFASGIAGEKGPEFKISPATLAAYKALAGDIESMSKALGISGSGSQSGKSGSLATGAGGAFTTFSASALSSAGRGGQSPTDRLLVEARDHRKISERQLEIARRNAVAAERLVSRMAMK